MRHIIILESNKKKNSKIFVHNVNYETFIIKCIVICIMYNVTTTLSHVVLALYFYAWLPHSLLLVGECSAFLASGSDPTMLCTICLLRT